MKQIQEEVVVDITSMETIKPSSPTPHHLRRHNLSFFDRLEAPKYMNTIICFSSSLPNPSKTTRSHVSNTLKTSLAHILSIYYPLAGRIADDDNLYVDCQDQGARYLEANVKGTLTNDDILSTELSSQLLSYDHAEEDVNNAIENIRPLLVVQANFFECGGLVIGLMMYHRVADAVSLFTFLKNWASVARMDTIILPDFGAAKLFPPVDLTGVKPLKEEEEEERVSRRFVFSNDTILRLCKKYTTFSIENHEVAESRPSRVEALTTFIWKRYIASTQQVQSNKTTYRLGIAVNLRSRFDPPLKPSAFGSIADMTVAIDTSPNESDIHHSKLLAKSIRTSILNLKDPENLKLYRNTVQLVPMVKEMYEWMNSENEVWILFSSFIRLYDRVRDADFGWGAPSAMHVHAPKIFSKNYVVFMDSNDGNGGIEASMSFTKEDMAKFEVDHELLAHAC